MKFHKTTEVHILQHSANLNSIGKSGVSMHCHTQHSKEMLEFLPYYAERLPIISYLWRKEGAKYCREKGKKINFSASYWSPPLTARSVFDAEKEQINEAGLNAIVSITDHDSIDGTLELNKELDNPAAPISLEWTVPFDFGFFHVGVHNLPVDRAAELTTMLLDYTFTPDSQTNERLREILSALNELPCVLLVLNHPIWDIEMVGAEKHALLLKDFLETHGCWIHALEINGFRSWSENKAVLDLAEAFGMPVATGGDRHGCKPNTMINVTNAATFEEFVEEIRVDKRSEVAVMPEYQQPLHSRQLESFSEILKFYPEFPDARQRWFDRVFFDINDGKGLVPLSAHGWKRGGPAWLRAAIWTLGFLGSPTVRPIFAAAVKREDHVAHDVDMHKSINPGMGKLSPKLSSGTV